MQRYSTTTGWHEMSGHFPDAWVEEDPKGAFVKYEDAIAELNAKDKEIERLRMALKETLDAMDLSDYPALHIAGEALALAINEVCPKCGSDDPAIHFGTRKDPTPCLDPWHDKGEE